MGGKKGPEKNRKYEKDRRDRFNDRFNELNQLLPDSKWSTIKATKAEIINRAILYLKDTQSKNRKPTENESTNEVAENKINELQKKIVGLLKIIKELIRLLHKANINFPESLPVDDFTSFKEAYIECKRKLKEPRTRESKKKKTVPETSSEDVSLMFETESVDSEDEISVQSVVTTSSSSEPITTLVSQASACKSEPQNVCNAQVMNVNSPNVLHVNANPMIIPQGNLVAVNGLPNSLLNSLDTPPTILVNKQVTVPTLILMQNNIVPVSNVQQISTSQHKLIVPKTLVNTTKTTFINKKPIPAVRPYKSNVSSNDCSCRMQLLKRKHNRRSKGILVKYPKRKPPSKKKKKEDQITKTKEIDSLSEEVADKAVDNTTLEACNSTLNTYTESTDDIGKNYTDNLFDTQDIQSTGQFIDFFDNTSRSANNTTDNVSPTFVESTVRAETNVNSTLINSEVPKEPPQDPEPNKSVNYLSTSSFSNNENIVRSENAVLDKRKCLDKGITPLTIQCNLDENKSVAKDLNLSFDDKSKHYEPSFDEFSSDLFLHVPSSGQHADSISPTATFLSNFPLVSSFKTTDLLPEHEEDSNNATTNSTTILQIGNLGSPSTLLFTNKNTMNRDTVKGSDKEETYAFCNSTSELENRNDKKKECKETTPRDVFNLDTFMNQSAKNLSCSKDAITQNLPLYPTSTSSSFPSYARLTKYNDIPTVTSSYYSFSSSPAFSVTKTSSDLVTDYNSWMPTYNQEDASKEKKRDKSTSTSFCNTFSLPVNEVSSLEKSKPKKTKQNGSRNLVNWMTSPDSRNVSETLQPFPDMFPQSKDDSSVPSSVFVNSPNVQNNANFASYSSTDYYLDNQSYGESQVSNKITYSSTNPASYSWSPSKTALPTLSLDTPNMILPSTLPTLVGDLALGNNAFNSYDSVPKKNDIDRKKNNYQKTSAQNASSFLSVTQLVDPKSVSRKSNICHYDENRDKCYKENYDTNKSTENNSTEFKKTYSSPTCKESVKNQFKCRKETVKCNSSNSHTNRCLSKENKKDTRLPQKLCDYSSPQTSCQMVTSKEANPLSNKNTNYSAEALIGSNNHSNSCSAQNYFSYDSSTSYNNCPPNKKVDEADSLANVGYYTNANYIYPNNFQTFNNYGFSNQYCNNYTTQMQHSSFQKKKDDGQQSKQDTEWYKDSFSSYSTIVPSEFPSQQKEKCKQSFSNKYNCGQKSSGVYNSYYQYGSTPTALNHPKNNCNFNSTAYSFNQTGQQCLTSNCNQASGYEMKSNRNSSTNTNNGVPPTTLTNFNLSTIIPEINDKHCMQSRGSTVGNEKNNSFKYLWH